MDLGACVIVPREFGADRKEQQIIHQRHFILHKDVKTVVCTIAGQEPQIECIANLVSRVAVTKTPDGGVVIAPAKTMLKINVHRVAVLAKTSCLKRPLSPVVVKLQ